jgi:hypothetical protein
LVATLLPRSGTLVAKFFCIAFAAWRSALVTRFGSLSDPLRVGFGGAFCPALWGTSPQPGARLFWWTALDRFLVHFGPSPRRPALVEEFPLDCESFPLTSSRRRRSALVDALFFEFDASCIKSYEIVAVGRRDFEQEVPSFKGRPGVIPRPFQLPHGKAAIWVASGARP